MAKMLKIELFKELAKLPKLDKVQVDKALEASLQKFDKKIIVLDDDPTGTQTIHNINVYTDWEQDTIDAGFVEYNDMFYILTNSRALSEQDTSEIHQLIAYRIMKTFKKYRKDFIIISRGDSTLRGHFPTETDALRRSFEGTEIKPFDGEILIPFFKEGGRFTINDIHYVEEDKYLVPIGETEFAKSKRFRYSASDLKDYIEEKTHGKYRRDSVISISLEDLRAFKVDEIAKTLEDVKNFNKVIVNAVDYVDIKVFTIALLQAMAKGKQFLFRTAAGFPKVIGRIEDKALLTREELINHNNSHGGLIIVGSHMPRTNAQLQELRKNLRVNFIEFNHSLIDKPDAMKIEVQRILRKAVEKVQHGQTVVIFTGRKFYEAKSPEYLHKVSEQISAALSSIVSRFRIEPSFLIAKGGITASDIATKGLGVKKAVVLGQAAPGIPVWKLSEECKFPQMPYIIFPGNVGESDTLYNMVKMLQG